MPSVDRETIRGIVAGLEPAEYVRKVIVVETPEEAKAREEAGRPAPQESSQ